MNCDYCGLKITSYEDKSADGTLHAQCERKSRHEAIPLGMRQKRPAPMTQAELNTWRQNLAQTYPITYTS